MNEETVGRVKFAKLKHTAFVITLALSCAFVVGATMAHYGAPTIGQHMGDQVRESVDQTGESVKTTVNTKLTGAQELCEKASTGIDNGLRDIADLKTTAEKIASTLPQGKDQKLAALKAKKAMPQPKAAQGH